jgi:hypothetical protein
MNSIQNKAPTVPSPSVYTTAPGVAVTDTTAAAETQIVTTHELPPQSASLSNTGSSSAHTQDLEVPSGVPTSKEIQTAYDSINWENPSLESIMKLMVMICSKLKASNNAAKWAEANLQMNSLMKEAANMKDAASVAMWAKITGSLVSIGASTLSLGSSISQIKQVNALSSGKMFSAKDANGKFEIDEKAFQRLNADIGQINAKGAMRSAGIDIIKAAGQGAEAIVQNAADQYNVQAKKDAAEATQRGAHRDSAQQAEQSVDENIRKTQDILQSLVQLLAESERSVIQKI